jgi:hypothetical protein
MTPDELQELTAFLAATPQIVGQFTEGLTTADLVLKPSESQFSILENVCHLRDIELEGYTVRINKLLSDADPFLQDLNGAKLALDRNYNAQSLDRALTAFQEARRGNVGRTSEMSPDELNRTGVLEGSGPITLSGLLLKMREHDQGHLDELRNLRNRLLEFNAGRSAGAA